MDKESSNKLIEAATPLFAWKGFSGVSIRELAKAAGVNSALISYYFGSKEGLYAAVLESQLAHLLQAIEEVHKKGLPPEQRIEASARAVSGVHRRQPFLLRLMQGELVNPTVCFENVVKPYFKKLLVFLPATIQEGKNTGSFDQETNPVYAALALASMVNFYFIVKPIVDQVLPDTENRDEAYISQVLKIYLNGVRRREHAEESVCGDTVDSSAGGDLCGD